MGVSSLCSLPKSLEPVVHRTQVLLNYSVFASQRRVPGILAHGGGSCSDGRECAGGEARLSCALIGTHQTLAVPRSSRDGALALPSSRERLRRRVIRREFASTATGSRRSGGGDRGEQAVL